MTSSKPTELSALLDEFFEFARTDHLQGHPLKLQRKPNHMDVRRSAFSQRAIGAWSELPEEMVLSDTVDTSKWNLDSPLLRNCDKYNEHSVSSSSLQLAHNG
ncbi:unnamed protein product [Dibothriocephalus latus]|uniref:Uncharacterized protein n=1 Tax=Dibothriocephalus latus TaxID=60516 RepID=A0A3P7L7R6_DIBLA|nr:unnamed protein product [Dibothriocephalus latus]